MAFSLPQKKALRPPKEASTIRLNSHHSSSALRGESSLFFSGNLQLVLQSPQWKTRTGEKQLEMSLVVCPVGA